MEVSTAELAEEVVYITSPQYDVQAGEGAGRAGGAGSLELGRRLLGAARRGDTGAVLQLMAAGAPFTADWLGTSPLHAAAAGAHADTCAVLLRAGVSRDARTKVERTPLHLAAGGGHERVVALLLARGAAVDPRDMLRMTPLHWAAERGHAAAAGALLAAGADPRAASKFRKTPLQLAAARGHLHVLRLLEEAARTREARDSVSALASAHEQGTEIPAAEQQQALESIERLQTGEAGGGSEPQQAARVQAEEGAAGTGAGAGEAAALLRRHGITLLPPDSSTTVLNAIQSGRTVVLSDAGKLMLKDTPAVAAPKGVILTAAPARAPLAPGGKVFTLNNKLRAHPAPAPAPAPAPDTHKKVLSAQDMQIKLVPVSSGRRLGVSMKAKARRAGAAAAAGAAAPVKIILQKAADKPPAPEASPAPAGGEGYLCVPAEFLSSTSPTYLRAQLLAAHRSIHELSKQLRALQDRLDEGR